MEKKMDRVDVVIIDDDEGIRWALQQVLALCNLNCTAVGGAMQGIDAVSRYHPHLAIVDIKLGAINGFEVASQIGQINDEVKILFVTGYREAITNQVKVEENIIGVLEKPFNVEELMQLVTKIIPREPSG